MLWLHPSNAVSSWWEKLVITVNRLPPRTLNIVDSREFGIAFYMVLPTRLWVPLNCATTFYWFSCTVAGQVQLVYTMCDLARKNTFMTGTGGQAWRQLDAPKNYLHLRTQILTGYRNWNSRSATSLKILKTLDTEMLDLVQDEDAAEEVNQEDEFLERVYVVHIKINRVLNSTSTPTECVPMSATLSTDVSSSNWGGSHVKILKLSIQPCIGELTTWTLFWESYYAAIHDNPSLTDIEKISYLRSPSKHTALDSISGLSLTAPN